jgi:hypothetical protein
MHLVYLLVPYVKDRDFVRRVVFALLGMSGVPPNKEHVQRLWSLFLGDGDWQGDLILGMLLPHPKRKRQERDGLSFTSTRWREVLCGAARQALAALIEAPRVDPTVDWTVPEGRHSPCIWNAILVRNGCPNMQALVIGDRLHEFSAYVSPDVSFTAYEDNHSTTRRISRTQAMTALSTPAMLYLYAIHSYRFYSQASAYVQAGFMVDDLWSCIHTMVRKGWIQSASRVLSDAPFGEGFLLGELGPDPGVFSGGAAPETDWPTIDDMSLSSVTTYVGWMSKPSDTTTLAGESAEVSEPDPSCPEAVPVACTGAASATASASAAPPSQVPCPSASDTGATVALDASLDAPLDGSLDAPMDAPLDAPMDAPLDAPMDAPLDAPMDGSLDAHSPTLLNQVRREPSSSAGHHGAKDSVSEVGPPELDCSLEADVCGSALTGGELQAALAAPPSSGVSSAAGLVTPRDHSGTLHIVHAVFCASPCANLWALGVLFGCCLRRRHR